MIKICTGSSYLLRFSKKCFSTTGSPNCSVGFAMRGDGHYNENSAPQYGAQMIALKFAQRVAQQCVLPYPIQANSLIVDYGCSQGAGSAIVLPQLAATVRDVARDENLPLTLVYSDLPFNDFNSVFKVLAKKNSQYKHRFGEKNTFEVAAGCSFFEQVVPSNSVCFGYSATAMHWLSSKPGNVRSSFASLFAEGSDLLAFASLAASDWKNILMQRGRELQPGGVFVVANACRDSDGDAGNSPVFHCMDEAVRELVSEGVMSPQQAEAFTQPDYYRTREEHLDAATLAAAGLVVMEEEMTRLTDPILPRYRAGELSRQQFAAAWAGFFRSWSEVALLQGLIESGEHDVSQQEHIVEAVYGRVEEVLGRKDPEDLHCEIYRHYIAFQKPHHQ